MLRLIASSLRSLRASSFCFFLGETPLESYSVALSRAPGCTKEREGDHRTPEGDYTIDAQKQDSTFHRALHISYPSPTDSASAAQGGVKPGSDIVIHGIRNGLGRLGAFHRTFDWTSGCIAVTDKQIEELHRAFQMAPRSKFDHVCDVQHATRCRTFCRSPVFWHRSVSCYSTNGVGGVLRVTSLQGSG